ncbi:hypothetical protein [Phormidium sp. CCY1219]|uniref:hypothetical protein n=1 Tax=Phormidium sp. CCY1219 TaxID=2886104 RepID=UPI002D1F4126|nr:hypothetical protein [Phormidium sp. CCY1219]MEB3827445.1 hypothetical protein [Phormidium sp. CCY1219]
MSSKNSTTPTLTTLKDVDKAVNRYKTSEMSESELLSLWQAIRDASLNLEFSTSTPDDEVPGEDSY